MPLYPDQNDHRTPVDEHFPDFNRLEDIINDLKLREDILKTLADADREWEETDHDQVRRESIQRLRENILSYVHPYLIHFAADANWISPDEFTYLIYPHSNNQGSGCRRVMRNTRTARRFAEFHQRILDHWERDMA